MAEPSPTPPAQPKKIIAGADPFGTPLKDHLVAHLRSLNFQVEDLGTASYYSVAADVGRLVSSSPSSSLGLLACGTGAGVSIFANKFPGVYAATCLSVPDAVNARSINNSNVLSLSGLSTPPDAALQILDAWLHTPFKAPCPANHNNSWKPDIDSFLDNSLSEMSKIGQPQQQQEQEENQPQQEQEENQPQQEGEQEENQPQQEGEEEVKQVACALCCLASKRELDPIDLIPGGAMKIVRESPTSAFVSFEAGSVEPAHHHSFGHDLVVIKGRKRVWNLSKKGKFDLGVGDYLFTPAGDVHRVKYFEDTEFFIKWEGKWDMFFDEDIEAAKREIEKGTEEEEDGFVWVK